MAFLINDNTVVNHFKTRLTNSLEKLKKHESKLKFTLLRRIQKHRLSENFIGPDEQIPY